MRVSRLLQCTVAALGLTACGGKKDASDIVNPPPPVTATLTGFWSATTAGPLDHLLLHVTEASSDNVTGTWSGYDVLCSTPDAPECFYGGSIDEGFRHTSSVSFELIPNSPCGLVNATIAATFKTVNQVQGTITQHRCNAADRPPTAITLNRQ